MWFKHKITGVTFDLVNPEELRYVELHPDRFEAITPEPPAEPQVEESATNKKRKAGGKRASHS